MSFHIYEFCTGMERVSKNGKWVSGASLSQIDESRSNYNPIPQPIRNAVENLLFEIDKSDSYYPLQGEVALIARDLGDYSVLAAATKEVDDKGARPLIAYRYFWLNNDDLRKAIGQDGDWDGVGTLVYWWYFNTREKQGCFIMNPNTFNSNFKNPCLCPNNGVYKKQEFIEKFFPKNIHDTQKSPFCFYSSNDSKSLRGLEIQALALKVNRSPSWAWNVRYLEHPEEFNIIYCADEDAYNRMLSRLPQTKEKPKTEEKETKDRQKIDSNNIPKIAIYEAKIAIYEVCYYTETSNKHSFLIELAKIIKFSENLISLKPLLLQEDLKNADFPDSNTINLFRKKKGGEPAIRYVTLMVILLPRDLKVSQNSVSISELRKQLKKLKNNEKALLVKFIEILLDAFKDQDDLIGCSPESLEGFHTKIENLKKEVHGQKQRDDISPKTKLNLIISFKQKFNQLPKFIQTVLIILLIIGVITESFFYLRPVINSVFWRNINGQIINPYNCTTQENLHDLLFCLKLAEDDAPNYSNSQEVLNQAKNSLIDRMKYIKSSIQPQSIDDETGEIAVNDDVEFMKKKFLPTPYNDEYKDQQIILVTNFIIGELNTHRKYKLIETDLKTCKVFEVSKYGKCLERYTTSKNNHKNTDNK